MQEKTKIVFEDYKKIIEQKLDEYIPVKYPEEIWESMRYSVLAGGKRLRPVLCLETCKVLSGDYTQAIPTACAIEMLHSQSLIHDDLPCMDNDDYRRGKPTNHKVFGESTAVLAGDALLSFAPQIIIQKTPKTVPEQSILRVLEEFLVSAGAEKLIAGQVVDIASEGKQIDKQTLNFIHDNKTAALFKLSLRTGAILGGADENKLKALTHYAEKLGLAFQITDDILDATGDVEILGKKTHADDAMGKTTFLSFMSVDKAHEYAVQVTEKAKAAIEKYQDHEILSAFADDLLDRKK